MPARKIIDLRQSPVTLTTNRISYAGAAELVSRLRLNVTVHRHAHKVRLRGRFVDIVLIFRRYADFRFATMANLVLDGLPRHLYFKQGGRTFPLRGARFLSSTALFCGSSADSTHYAYAVDFAPSAARSMFSLTPWSEVRCICGRFNSSFRRGITAFDLQAIARHALEGEQRRNSHD